MHLRTIGVGMLALAAAGMAGGCGGGEQKPAATPQTTQEPEGPARQPGPVLRRGLPTPGRYDAHTPAALVDSVRQAVADRDFRGLLRLVENEARFEFSRNAKEWFFSAIRLMPSKADEMLAEKGLTRERFDLMDDEHYTAYAMWLGEKHQDLVAQLSGRLLGVDEVSDGAEATFAYSTDAGPQLVTFPLVRTEDGWRIVVPGKVQPASRPASAPASAPASMPASEPAEE